MAARSEQGSRGRGRVAEGHRPESGIARWFGHNPAKWEEFQKRYWAELEANPDAVTDLRRRIREGAVTFVYAARDEQHNGALALKEYLRRHPS